MPALPIELVDMVVSFLPSEPVTRTYSHDASNHLGKPDAMRVAKCALVCRNWVASSRRVLFYTVCVRQWTAHGFAKLFRQHQRLTFLPFIRELEFRGPIVYHSWMERVFPKIAKHLPITIRTLTFEGTWVTKPRLVSPNLCGVIRFELIASWDLDLSEVLKCIASFPALEELTVWLSHGWTDTTVPEPCVRPAETLRSLNLKGRATERLLEWIQSSSAVVSELRFYFPTGTTTLEFLRSAARYIASLGPSLAALSLIFEVDDPRSVLKEAFSDFLRQNTRLRSLCIEANPSQTLSLFNRASLPPSLESVRLAVGTPPLLPSPYPPVWLEIDRVLVPLPSLRRLEVARHYFPLAGTNSAEFPLCEARGIIEAVTVESWFRG